MVSRLWYLMIYYLIKKQIAITGSLWRSCDPLTALTLTFLVEPKFIHNFNDSLFRLNSYRINYFSRSDVFVDVYRDF